MVDEYIDLIDANLNDREKDAVILFKSGCTHMEVMQKLNVSDGFIRRLIDKVRKAEGTHGLNVSHLDNSARRDAKFREIVQRAMDDGGLSSIDEKSEFMKYAIGEDYQTLEYQLWPDRIRENVKLINIDRMASVYYVIRAAAEVWKSSKIIMSVN